jgi:hypothetical protein
MGYVVAAILVLLIVAGFITFLVMNSMRKGAGRGSGDPSVDESARGGPPGIGEDPTPLGDTSQHAGDQSEGGATEGERSHSGEGHELAGHAALLQSPSSGGGSRHSSIVNEERS